MEFKESWVEKLHRAEAQQAERDADPFREKAEAIVRGMQAISTFALLDLLGLPKTTGNGRRIAQTMRSLGFIADQIADGSCQEAGATPLLGAGRVPFGSHGVERALRVKR